MMEPLKQWICDTCGGVIEAPNKGLLVWDQDVEDLQAYNFRIVHVGRCDKATGCRVSTQLHDVIGDNIFGTLFGFIDKHADIYPEESTPNIKDILQFSDVMKRLSIPYYEEARKYFSEAVQSGFFSGNPERKYLCDKDYLLEIIERFGKE